MGVEAGNFVIRTRKDVNHVVYYSTCPIIFMHNFAVNERHLGTKLTLSVLPVPELPHDRLASIFRSFQRF